jgi:predicted ArsR family transcriptional regulator
VSAPIRVSATGTDSDGAPRALATLSRLAELLPPGDSVLAVDAETASRVLEVTPRTARRLLRALAEEGLAWPLPPNRAPQPGRPRQSYRLVVERLDRHRTGDGG